jgi:hypothetical protein
MKGKIQVRFIRLFSSNELDQGPRVRSGFSPFSQEPAPSSGADCFSLPVGSRVPQKLLSCSSDQVVAEAAPVLLAAGAEEAQRLAVLCRPQARVQVLGDLALRAGLH